MGKVGLIQVCKYLIMEREVIITSLKVFYKFNPALYMHKKGRKI